MLGPHFIDLGHHVLDKREACAQISLGPLTSPTEDLLSCFRSSAISPLKLDADQCRVAAAFPYVKKNYNTGRTVSVYSFPKEDGLKKAWLAAINRKDFNLTTSSKVCELHFGQADFDYEASHFDSKTGQYYSAPLQVKRLKKDAVPSIFTGYPHIFEKSS
ncbi:hypothetical protein JTE90_008269 [Oedothorax gibbosus]|uniref:THAP-type domain-containing protein n=1 Tax=Oedothorax gibbosus TaxID=931172 RepID=A0AAV6UGW9_9ARAC|nr:hypothetical protein JTE90_008269 [Oedothorax gibbosus]